MSNEVSATYVYVGDEAYGTAWNGKLDVPTKNAVYDKLSTFPDNVLSGTYTPTLSNTTNIDSSTTTQCQYLRVGSVVHVSGRVIVDTTSGSADTVLGITLPIASTFSSTVNLAGAAASTDGGGSAGIFADTANSRAKMEWISADTSSRIYFFTFTYLVA